MTPRMLLLSSATAGLAVLAVTSPGATATPTCPDPLTRTACGGRVVAEALQSTGFLQFDTPTENFGDTLTAIAALSPAFVTVKPLAEWTGTASDQSFGGRPIWVARVTDGGVPRAGKKQVAISLSVHALEPAGREGGARYLEDLARWTAALPGTDRDLYSGDRKHKVSEVMTQTEVWIGFTNSDGWAAGDVGSTDPGPGFVRANADGADLNRDFATVGWYDRTGGRGIAESEPEIQGWTRLVRSFPNLVTSTDIHGELTTPNGAYSDLIIPAGSWTPTRQEQVDQFSQRMITSVERKFDEDGVVLGDLAKFTPMTGATPTMPANVAAAYDIVGYDDSGFMGDWFSQTQDSVHMDVENFLSNLAPNNVFSGVVEQSHVAAVRGNMEATIVEALETSQVKAELNYKRVAYVTDDYRTSSAPDVQDGDPGTGAPTVAGETQVPYDVSRLAYFEVLEQETGRAVDAVTPAQVVAGLGNAYDTLVVDDMKLSVSQRVAGAADTAPAVDQAAYVTALDAFATGGGQLLLTDQAVQLAADLDIVDPAALTLNRTDAGHVDFVEPVGDHPYEQGLRGKPSQTYYEVMLGYPSRVRAPNYGIERTAWESAGGTTVASVGDQGSGDSPNTALGTVARGTGQVTIFGAILPQALESFRPTPETTGAEAEETPHPFGLADYAVTITGGQVLDNVLSFQRAGAAPGTDVPEVSVNVVLPVVAGGMLIGTALYRRRQDGTAA